MQPYSIFSLLLLIVISIVDAFSMEVCSRDTLSQKKCSPCARKEEAASFLINAETVKAQLSELKEGWYLTHGGQRIRKDWKVRNFKVGMAFLQQVGDIAEDEGHHPGTEAFFVCLILEGI